MKSIEKLEKLKIALDLTLKNFITRKDLRNLIMQNLKISDSHAVNSWIQKLLSENAIQEPKGGIYPKNETCYLIPHPSLKQVLTTETISVDSENRDT